MAIGIFFFPRCLYILYKKILFGVLANQPQLELFRGTNSLFRVAGTFAGSDRSQRQLRCDPNHRRHWRLDVPVPLRSRCGGGWVRLEPPGISYCTFRLWARPKLFPLVLFFFFSKLFSFCSNLFTVELDNLGDGKLVFPFKSGVVGVLCLGRFRTSEAFVPGTWVDKVAYLWRTLAIVLPSFRPLYLGKSCGFIDRLL